MNISIIVPFYNTKLLFIKSLIAQLSSLNKNNFEVIFVNDGSDSDISNFVSLECKAYGYTYIDLGANFGVSHARNIAICKAKFNYITFVDADDLIDLSVLNALIKYREIDLIMFKSDIFFADKDIKQSTYELNEVVFEKHLDELYSQNIFNISMRSACGKILNKKIILNNKKYFDEELPFYEDALFMTNYYLHTKTYAIIDNVLYHYRMNENSSSKRFNKLYILKFETFFNKYKTQFSFNLNYLLGLYLDTFKSMLIDKVVRSFKKGHYLYSISVCKSESVLESAKYLLENDYLNNQFDIKLANKIINRKCIQSTNLILLHQLKKSFEIKIRKAFSK